jgi:hypothetical protein
MLIVHKLFNLFDLELYSAPNFVLKDKSSSKELGDEWQMLVFELC